MILVILQARTSSSRLPGKVLRPLMGRAMILRELDRLKECCEITQLVLATSTDPTDDELAQTVEAAGYDVYRGSLDDVLERYYHCAQRYMPTNVVRLTGDCPVIDPHIVDRVIAQHIAEHNDYTSTTERFPDGLDTEVMTYAALEKAYQEAALPSEREHVTLYIRRHPERFRVGTVDCAEDYGAMRWTVDEPQDFALIEKIYERLYPQHPDFAMEDILTLFCGDETLAHINQGIMRNEGLKKSIAAEKVL